MHLGVDKWLGALDPRAGGPQSEVGVKADMAGAGVWAPRPGVPRLHGSLNCGEPRKPFEQRRGGPSVCQKAPLAQLQADGGGGRGRRRLLE